MMLRLLAVSLLVSTAAAQQAMEADVLILGGGAAGLTAAKHLSEKNVSFLIIEGAGEIGGRVKSMMFGGKMVEFGTPGLFGKMEMINKTVSKYNITGNYVDYENYEVRTSSAQIATTEYNTAYERMEEAQTKITELYSKIKDGMIHDMSIRVALEHGNWFPKNSVDDIVEVYDYDYEFAKIPELISTQGFEAAKPFQDTPYFATDPKGLQNMLKMFANEFLEVNDTRLKLNTVVENITHTQSSVTVSAKGGSQFTGKYAIVTFSMGVLKSRSVTFDPVLPDWKLNTIYKTSMDVYTQIYAKFGQKFWRNNQFILHVNPRRGYYPIIFNIEANGFYPAGTNILVFHVMGEEARRIERADKNTVLTEIRDVVRGMYGSSTPAPEDILVTKWLDNALAKGSFSSRQVGGNVPQFTDALTSPVGRVYFAGEAYHDILDGFLEGAMLSANHTVMKLSECMMNNKCHQFDPNPPKPTPQPPTCGATRHTFLLPCIITTLLSVVSL